MPACVVAADQGRGGPGGDKIDRGWVVFSFHRAAQKIPVIDSFDPSTDDPAG